MKDDTGQRIQYRLGDIVDIMHRAVLGALDFNNDFIGTVFRAHALEFEAEKVPDQRLEPARLRRQRVDAQIKLITVHRGLNLPSSSPFVREPPMAMRNTVLIRHAAVIHVRIEVHHHQAARNGLQGASPHERDAHGNRQLWSS